MTQPGGAQTIHSTAQMREMGLYSGFVTQVNTGKELLRELCLVIRACCKVPSTDLMLTIMCLWHFTIQIIEIHSCKMDTE